MTSLRNRWPWVDMAIRSTCSSSAMRISSVAGSPMASFMSHVKPAARSVSQVCCRYARSLLISSDSRRFRSSKCRAANPSATCTSSSVAPVMRASPSMWPRIAASARECSMATRMWRYISAFEKRDAGLIKEINVERRDDDHHGPRERLDPPLAGERAHESGIAREPHQREDREGQLQAENHLAEHDERTSASVAIEHDHDNRGDDRQQARNQPSQPWAQANVEKAFHHDLSGQRAGQCGVLAGAEQRDGEERARRGGAEQRRQQLIGVLNLRDAFVRRSVNHR